MLVPNFVHDKAVNVEPPNEGHFTEQWVIFISQLIDQLQTNLSNEGYVVPGQTTDNISVIAASEQAQNGIRLLVDTDTNELKAIVNGVVKTVTLT
jgi:hypothetical protein